MPFFIVLQEVPRDTQQIERIHDSVLDAIHAALSKESLVKKLVLPFNETLTAATKVIRESECKSLILCYHPLLTESIKSEGQGDQSVQNIEP